MGAVAALAGIAALAACHKQPDGQVVATVNGDEVTLQELNTELQSTNIASGDKQAVQKALLQRVIDRKLIDGLAKDRDLQKSSDYLAQSRRLNELLLEQLYAKQQLAAVPVPSGADITKFMTDNPGVFANRQQLILDQIRFQQPTNPGLGGSPDYVDIAPTVSYDSQMRVGDTWTAFFGDWWTADTYTFEWLRDGATVVGTDRSYTLTAADLGHDISLHMTGSTSSGSAGAYSPEYGPVRQPGYTPSDPGAVSVASPAGGSAIAAS